MCHTVHYSLLSFVMYIIYKPKQRRNYHLPLFWVIISLGVNCEYELKKMPPKGSVTQRTSSLTFEPMIDLVSPQNKVSESCGQ